MIPRQGHLGLFSVAGELALAAWGLAELLALEVGVAERTVVAGEATLAAPVGFAALLAFALVARRVAHHRDDAARIARALLPLVGLGVLAARARILGPPSFVEVTLAPVLVGGAVARLPRRRSRSARAYSRRAALLVTVASGVVATGFALHALGLFDGFALGYRDLGEYAARVENTVRGRFLETRPGLPPFHDHWNPGLAAFAPVHVLTRRWLSAPELLTIAQAILLAALGPLSYAIARTRLRDPRAAALLALALLAAPAFTHLNVALSYGFHPVTPALVALFGAAWAYAARRRALAALLVLVAWSFEETVIVATFGGALALIREPARTSGASRRDGVLLGVGSLVAFALVTQVVLPLVNGAPYQQLGKFAHLGDSTLAIALSPFVRPRVFWGTLLDGASLAFVLGLLAPFLLLPLGRARWVVATLPVLAFACLRDEPRVKSIALHYHTTVLVWVFVGVVEAVRAAGGERRGRERRRRERRRALALGALAASLTGALLFGDAPFGRARRPFPVRPGLAAAVRELAIPTTASLCATQRAASHVISTHPGTSIVRPEELPRADVYLFDLDDAWTAPVPRLHRHVRDLRRAGFSTLDARGSFVVLGRGGRAGAPPEVAKEPIRGRPLEPTGLVLVGLEPVSDGRARFTWRVERATGGDWALVPLGPDGVAGEVSPIGGIARPTYERVAGEVFAEERALDPVRGLVLRAFDYLALDARGEEPIDEVARLLQAGRPR